VDLTHQRVVRREPEFCHDVIDDLSDMLVVLEVVEAAARMGGGDLPNSPSLARCRLRMISIEPEQQSNP
jgi:hypothetical protein